MGKIADDQKREGKDQEMMMAGEPITGKIDVSPLLAGSGASEEEKAAVREKLDRRGLQRLGLVEAPGRTRFFDPDEADGKPRRELNSEEVLSQIREMLDEHFGKPVVGKRKALPADDKIARVKLPIIEVTEPALEEGETVSHEEATEMLKVAVKMAGGQRQFCEEHGVSQALVSRVLAGKRRMGITVLAAIGLKPDQVKADVEEGL